MRVDGWNDVQPFAFFIAEEKADAGSGEDEAVTSVDATPTVAEMPTTPFIDTPMPGTAAPQADVHPVEKVHTEKPQQKENQKRPEEEQPKKLNVYF